MAVWIEGAAAGTPADPAPLIPLQHRRLTSNLFPTSRAPEIGRFRCFQCPALAGCPEVPSFVAPVRLSQNAFVVEPFTLIPLPSAAPVVTIELKSLRSATRLDDKGTASAFDAGSLNR